MKPQNFNRKNFTAPRLASATTCAVWFGPDQREAKYYHSWEDDLYKLTFPGNRTLYVVSQPRGFRQLKKMLTDFLNPLCKSYKADGFVRAEIYENFTGQTIYSATMTTHEDAESNPTMFDIHFRTDTNLKQPGRHRIADTLLSKSSGTYIIDPEMMREHLNFAWRYWMATSRFAPMRKYKAQEVVAEEVPVGSWSEALTTFANGDLKKISDLALRLKSIGRV